MENPNEKFYGIMNAELSLPSKDLLIVPHRNGKLIVNYPAFGPNPYLINIKLMSKKYFHSKRLPNVSFVDPTTSESISIAAYDFEKQTYKQFFNGRWLQLGILKKTSFVSNGKVIIGYELNGPNLEASFKKAQTVLHNHAETSIQIVRDLQTTIKKEKLKANPRLIDEDTSENEDTPTLPITP